MERHVVQRELPMERCGQKELSMKKMCVRGMIHGSERAVVERCVALRKDHRQREELRMQPALSSSFPLVMWAWSDKLFHEAKPMSTFFQVRQ